ncbi:hypothetical protein LJR235_004409 [Pararhizobium sp. LjRoot235]|uniref:hypothetical protein n=1 Tax=Pararhizobium sp. LjRoot235 TaxID=3342291 RepID=UPI003ECD5C4A
MTHYAWTIKARGRQDIKNVTTLAGIYDVLRIIDLPGFAPPEFVTMGAEISDHGHYTYNEGGDDEWSLIWTKVDDAPNKG